MYKKVVCLWLSLRIPHPSRARQSPRWEVGLPHCLSSHQHSPPCNNRTMYSAKAFSFRSCAGVAANPAVQTYCQVIQLCRLHSTDSSAKHLQREALAKLSVLLSFPKPPECRLCSSCCRLLLIDTALLIVKQHLQQKYKGVLLRRQCIPSQPTPTHTDLRLSAKDGSWTGRHCRGRT